MRNWLKRASQGRREFLTATVMAPFAGNIDLKQAEKRNRIEVFAMYSRYTEEDFKKCRLLVHTNKGIMWAPPIIKVSLKHEPFCCWLLFEDFKVGFNLADPYSDIIKPKRTFNVYGATLIDKSGEAYLREHVFDSPTILLANDILRLTYTFRET